MVPALRSLSSHLSSSSLSVSLPSYIFHLTFPTDSFSLASRQAHFHLVLKHCLYYFSRTALPYLDSLLSLQTAESIVCLHLYLRCCLVTKSCLNLCDPMDSSLQGSSVHGISQARILERVAISFPRGSSWPRDWPHISCIGRQISFFNHWATKEAHIYIYSFSTPIPTSVRCSYASNPLYQNYSWKESPTLKNRKRVTFF